MLLLLLTMPKKLVSLRTTDLKRLPGLLKRTSLLMITVETWLKLKADSKLLLVLMVQP